MTREFEPLTTAKLEEGVVCARPTQPLPYNVNLGDPAINVMTDLTRISAIGVRSHTPMDIANAKMIHYGVSMLLVIDGSDLIVGLLTANDVLGEKPMRHLQNFGGTYAAIKVSDLMTPIRELDAVGIEEVRHGTRESAKESIL